MSNRELTHHGILGMKWGVRNGPPYPLSPEDHSASERRAGWRKSLNKGSSTVSDSKAKEYDSEQIKRYLKAGAMFAAGAAAVYMGVKVMKNPQRLGYFIDSSRAFLDASIAKFSNTGFEEKVKKLSSKTTTELNFKVINKTTSSEKTFRKAAFDRLNLSINDQIDIYDDMVSGRLTNCVSCTSVSALREKGYDVIAKPLPERLQPQGGITPGRASTFWNNTKYVSIVNNTTLSSKNYLLNQGSFMDNIVYKTFSENQQKFFLSKLEKTLTSQKDGSYGELMVFPKAYGMGGHSIQYKKVDGQIKIFDNQLKLSFDSVREYFSRFSGSEASMDLDPAKTIYRDLTNATPNWDVLKEFIENA